MADFVTLTCPSCGGKLEITSDIDRFACSHCGREHIVKRSGGIISLSPVMDVLKRVEVGVDRTAAELAITRLQREIVGLQLNRNNLLQAHPRKAVPRRTKYTYFGAVLFLVGLCIVLWGLLIADNSTQPVILLVGAPTTLVGLGLIFFVSTPTTEEWDKTIGLQIKSLDEQIVAKSTELQRYQKVVSQ